MLNKNDTLLVMPTGSGKTLVMFLFALSLRKMPGNERSVVVVTMPLSSIISQQLSNPFCNILALSMKAQVCGTSCDAVGEARLSAEGSQPVSEEELLSQILKNAHSTKAHIYYFATFASQSQFV